MRRTLVITTIALTLTMSAATAATAAEAEPEPTDPPLGPPVVYDDPVGDAPGGSGPDLVACGVSEPWESLIRFSFEFADEPPISYDLETWSTDELSLLLGTMPDAALPDDLEYMLIVHGATLPQEVESGSALFDTTQTAGDEVFWGVVDVAVDGPTLTLTVDRKLIGDPETLYFIAATSSEGADEASEPDVCPDEELWPGVYELVG